MASQIGLGLVELGWSRRSS